MEQYFGGWSPGISCPPRGRLLIVPLITGGRGAMARPLALTVYNWGQKRCHCGKKTSEKGEKRGYVTVAMATEERVWRPWFL